MSKYADEGTIAHALAAMALTENRDAAAYINRIITSEDYQHSQLSPSGAHRWMRCAGSTVLEQRIKFVPRTFQMTVTREMAEGVQIYLDNVRQYAAGKELMVEQKLPVHHLTGEEGATGSGDAVILDWDAEEIQVHDLKFGKGVPVYAEENEQLMQYALGALREFGAIGTFKRARMVIHQPRLNHLSEWDCSIEDLELFAFKVKAAADVAHSAAAIREKEPERFETQFLSPGEKQCRFCDAKATCPALAKFVQKGVGEDFLNLDAHAAKPPVPGGGEELALKLRIVSLIESWCSAIAAHAEAELLAGRPVPGFKLVQGRKGARKWVSDEAAEEMLKSFRMKHDEMYDYSVISPVTAEKRLKEHPRQWTKALPLITQSDGKPSVAPESDKRPALVVKPVADEFQALDDAEGLA